MVNVIIPYRLTVWIRKNLGEMPSIDQHIVNVQKIIATVILLLLV